METFGSLDEASLLVVDMQADFINGNLTVPGAFERIPTVNFLIEVFEDLERPILYSLDWHPKETPHFNRWPAHCVAGTDGALIHDDVIYEPYANPNVFTVLKGLGKDGGYSVMSKPSKVFTWTRHSKTRIEVPCLEDVFAARKMRTVVVCGVATDHCVLASVLDLLRLGMQVLVVTDAVAGVDPETSQRALTEMQAAGARLVTREDLDCLAPVDSPAETRLYSR